MLMQAATHSDSTFHLAEVESFIWNGYPFFCG
jgi:hypothetical protein